VLIGLLTSEFDTVRDWAAGALGDLEIADAVPALEQAYEATKQRGTPPNWMEPVSIRWALTALGARRPVVPPLTASLAVRMPPGLDTWPSARLADVLEELATHDQVAAYFQLWRVKSDGLYWMKGSDYELHWKSPWDVLVREAADKARAAAADVVASPETVANIEWLSRSDL
jgi:hypothetical protein